jgi:hypothetical protein
MIGWLLRAAVACIGIAGFLYVTFIFRLGDHTLYEHLARISTTTEARALAEALRDAQVEVRDAVLDRMHSR